jgi:hypothetical protein
MKFLDSILCMSIKKYSTGISQHNKKAAAMKRAHLITKIFPVF